jgi:hypothetical protein
MFTTCHHSHQVSVFQKAMAFVEIFVGRQKMHGDHIRLCLLFSLRMGIGMGISGM